MAPPGVGDPTQPSGIIAGLKARLDHYIGIRVGFRFAVYFFLKDIWSRLRQGDLRVLYSNHEARERSFAQWYKTLGHNFADYEGTTAVPSLVAGAHGVVVDLGPGTGNQLGRFDASRIEHVYGVEPNTSFVDVLVERLGKTALKDKYTLIPCGIENAAELAKFGVVPGSVDCIVSMQVMCSLPNLEERVKEMWKLLKPGGQLIFWEHCRNSDLVTRSVQWLWCLVWPVLIGGCRLDRPIRETLLKAGNWQAVDIESDMKPHELLPRVWGTLVKAEA